MSIRDEVNTARQDIRTDDYAISISEWISMYEQGDLDIHPEFQRFFRWSESQKSNLIESILLGIPLPPIFVSQREDGVWDVIDGLQRLSTIFEFVGILRDEAGSTKTPTRLKRTPYLQSLEGIRWESAEEDDNDLPDDLKRIFKRSKIHVSIILRESTESTKYELFQRLNTGGSHLSSQEVRNCILIMTNRDFYEWMHALSKRPSFLETVSISEKLLLESYDLEQVLRFLAFTMIEEEELSRIGDIGSFLTEKMIKFAHDEQFDYQKWELLFDNTFSFISERLGENAFKRFNAAKNRHEGAFLVSQYEAVACGVAWNIACDTLRGDLEQAVQEMWAMPDFRAWSGSGIAASRRLKHLLPFAREHFKVE